MAWIERKKEKVGRGGAGSGGVCRSESRDRILAEGRTACAMGIDGKKLCGVGTRYKTKNGGLSLKACRRS
jgi:hypothetical protein